MLIGLEQIEEMQGTLATCTSYGICRRDVSMFPETLNPDVTFCSPPFLRRDGEPGW